MIERSAVAKGHNVSKGHILRQHSKPPCQRQKISALALMVHPHH
jgi:hypothetical protein